MKNNNLKNIIIGVLVILVIALSEYICYDKFLSKDNNTNNNVSENKKDVVLHVGMNEEKSVEVNGKTINISLKDSEIIIKNNKTNVIKKNLTATTIDLYNETIVIQYNWTESSYLEVYDIDGTFLKKIDDKEIENADFIELVSIKDEEMIVNVSNNNGAGPRVNDKISLCGCGQCSTSIEPYMDIINQNRNNIVRATYKVTINKNNFKYELQNITQTLGEYLDDVIKNKWCVSVD